MLEFRCDTPNFCPDQGGGGGASSEINITPSGIEHVVSGHTPGGAEAAGNCTFLRSLGQGDIENLIRNAASAPARRQPNGNYARVVTADQTVGYDVVTQLFTDTYTGITDAAGNLVTAHPGLPD